MRMIVEQALRQAGCGVDHVSTAANGALGLALLRSERSAGRGFDVILSDVHMPVMDGLAFVTEKRRLQLERGVPTLMLTGDGGDPKVGQAIAAGAAGYLAKPFTLDELRAALGAVLAVAA